MAHHHRSFSSSLVLIATLGSVCVIAASRSVPAQTQQAQMPPAQGQPTQGAGRQGRPAPPPQTGPCDPLRNNWGRDFDRDKECQAASDKIWSDAMRGAVKMQKLTYKSRKDGLEIPFFLFEPLKPKGPKGNAALVWVHPDIRGHLYEYYIPYVTRSGLTRLRRHRARVSRQHRLRPGVLRRDRLRRRGGRRRRDGGGVSEDERRGGGSRAHRHHRLEPRRDDHAALDHARAGALQGRGRERAGDESLPAPRVGGRRAAASGDRSGQSLRRPARRAATTSTRIARRSIRSTRCRFRCSCT